MTRRRRAEVSIPNPKPELVQPQLRSEGIDELVAHAVQLADAVDAALGQSHPNNAVIVLRARGTRLARQVRELAGSVTARGSAATHAAAQTRANGGGTGPSAPPTT